jgi:tape measure domain-containing protein
MAQMGLDTAIRLSAEVKGGGNIDRVKKSLQDLAKSGQTTAREMGALRSATFQMARANDNTIAGIRNSISAFRGLQEQAAIGSRQFQRYGAEIQKLEGKLRGLDGTASQTNTRIAGMAAAAGRLIAAYAGIEAVRFVFGNAAELESQTRSLEVLTGSAERAKDIVQQLQQLGAVTPFTSTELIDTAKRLQAFGVETEKVVDITSRLADVSGATGAELAGLATAYGQVQAKGRLQGEELLQFQERGVALQQVLRKEYGLTGVEFQKALEKGQISAEAVEYALRKLTDTGGKYANGAIAQSDTLKGRMSTLADSVQVLAQTIGKTLDPVFKWALTQATAVVSEIQRLIDEANNTGGARDREAQYARNADTAVRAMGLNPLTQQGMMAEMRQRNIEQQRADYRLRQQTERAAAMPGVPSAPVIPPLTGGTAGGGGSGGGASGGGGSAPSFQPSSRARALIAAAQKLGVSPLDLATIISFETAGTFSPSIRGGAGGNYQGLIQFGIPERRQYGVTPNQSFEEQVMGPVVRYFQDRFQGAGMSTQGASLLDLYTTVLAGNPRANRNARDSFDTSPISGVQRMGPHRQKALATFFGGSTTNVGFGAVDQAEAMIAGYDEQQQAAEKLKQEQDQLTEKIQESIKARTDSVVQLNKETELLKAVSDEERIQIENAYEANNIKEQYRQLKAEALDLDKEAQRLGIENNLQEQTARLDAEERHALANLQLKTEQDLNKVYEERTRLFKEFMDQVAMPTAYNQLEQQRVVLDEILEKYPAIGGAADAAADLATRGLAEVVTGAKSAKEVFVDFLNGVASALLDAAKKMIAQYIAIGIARMFAGFASSTSGSSFQPSTTGPFQAAGSASAFNFNPGAMVGRAVGGPTMAGQPYTVGERGPELFVPYQSGTIIPAEATEALEALNNASLQALAVPFQRDATTRGGNDLAVPFQRGMEGLSVPFQRDTTGGAAGDRASTGASIDVRFETIRVGDLDVVTREEAQRIGRESAQRGAELAQKRLINNPTARRAVGMS